MRSVRRFRGHKDRITDLAIAQDARWLLSASLDGTVRVWDVPSARCLQVPGVHVLSKSALMYSASTQQLRLGGPTRGQGNVVGVKCGVGYHAQKG